MIPDATTLIPHAGVSVPTLSDGRKFAPRRTVPVQDWPARLSPTTKLFPAPFILTIFSCIIAYRLLLNHFGNIEVSMLAFQLLSQLAIMDFTPQPDMAVRPSDTIEFKALLLVDDDKQLASALQWILADENFLVDVANDGDEALLKVKANEYDAIVCDVMMPKLRGDEFYLKAREVRPVLADRFIFITGFAADAKINLFLTQTDSKYLVKPFPIQHLINCLKQLLD